MTWLSMHWPYALASFLFGAGGGVLGGTLVVGGRFSYWHGYKDGARMAHEYIRAIVERQAH